MSHEAARGELLDGAGTQFDLRVIVAFLACIDRRAS
jgi:hypothetical protein